ncbi:hypothetical protein ACFQZ0_00315 [Streptomyces erythrogriseus]|uniref:Uncharacterized protein n=1 Tax=Streptomyces erythrogriseus TaxID=284027 RepID=A0ABN3WJ33_9ACTN
MTAGTAGGLLQVRGTVLLGGQERMVQVQVSAVGGWGELPVTARKAAVHKVKTMLLMQGALCLVCADRHERVDPCRLCPPVLLQMHDGRGEYPTSGDMLRVYSVPARFSLVATVGEARAVYSALEVAGLEWLQTAPELRHRLMRAVVDRLLRLYPGTDPGEVRTLIWDGTRENPYPFHWALLSGG